MALQCPRCGTINEDGSHGCSSCGVAFKLPGRQAGAQAPADGQAPGLQASPAAGRPSAAGPPTAGAAQPRPQGAVTAPPRPAAAATAPPQPAGTKAFAPLKPEEPDGKASQVAAAAATGPMPVVPAAGTAPSTGVPAGAPRPAVEEPGSPAAAAAPAATPSQAMPYGYGMYPGWAEQQAAAAAMMPYAMGMAPFAPYGPYGFFSPYAFMPPMPFFGGYSPFYPPFMPSYPPPMPYSAPYAGAAPYPSPYPSPYAQAPRGRMKTLYIVLIIIGVLLLIGGAVTAAVLLAGNGNSAFNLGDASVTGTDIDFKDMVLKQESGQLVLTGTYDNNTKRSGDVYVTIQTASGGTEGLISFTVPVVPGKGHSFTEKKASSAKISSATLGTLIYTSDSIDTDTSTYPWDEGRTTTPSTSPRTVPETVPETVPFDEYYEEETTPDGSMTSPTF